MKKIIEKKLRDLTKEEYVAWKKRNCHVPLFQNCCNTYCANCIFKRVNCSAGHVHCWVKNKDLYSDKFLDQKIKIEVEVETPKLSKKERAILENLDDIEYYNYIARDEDGAIYLYAHEPKKHGGDVVWNVSSGFVKKVSYSKLFKFIKWEDDEPYLIKELLERK